MRTLLYRVPEILLTSLTACLVSVALVTMTTIAPVHRLTFTEAPVPIVREFNATVSSLMLLPIPPWYSQGMNPSPRVDNIFIKFNITADFTPVWDWNTLTVYAACIAQYRTNRYTMNEVTLNDIILRSRDSAVWKVRNSLKYPLEDAESGTLAGARVQLLLRYHTMHTYGYSDVVEISPMGQSLVTFLAPRTYSTDVSGKASDTALSFQNQQDYNKNIVTQPEE